MAYPYSPRIFAGFERRPSLGVGVLLGSAGLILAAGLLLKASSPAPASSTTPLAATAALPFGPGRQFPVPATLSLLTSLPAATWLPPYSATDSYARPTEVGGEAVSVVYHPAQLAPAAAPASSALRRSWDTIKRMFQ